jgi:hypothetical protein
MYLDGFGLRWQSDEYSARRNAIRDRTRPAYEFDYVCQRQRVVSADAQNERCVLGAKSASPPRVILWGDSNAAHFVGIVGVFARVAGFSFRNVALGTCPPLVDDPAPYVNARRLSDCRSSGEPILAAVRAADVVIISADWPYYFRHSDRFFDSFFLTANSLAEAGKLVILIGKVPVIPDYDRRCRERALSYPLLECPLSASPPMGYVVSMNGRLREFAERTPNVAFFDVSPYLCQNGMCSAFDAKGKPLYFDRNHLSLPASWEIGEMILRQEGVPAPFIRIVDWLQKSEQVKAVGSL